MISMRRKLKNRLAKGLKTCGFLIVSMFFTFSLRAETGSISGKIFDAESGEQLIGAAVVIDGTILGAATDLDGEYHIQKVSPGTYTLTISYISYQTVTKENIVVEAGKTTSLNVHLKPAEFLLTEMEVVARANRESENMMLLEQRKALLVTQAVSAHEMSRKGIGDAEVAVTKVSGISKQDGVKNVFVRGLGDRYNSTTLNGFPIPSEDPEYKNIALNFFGTDVIQNISVSKVFNSSLAGDVGGAVIDISSKELVGDEDFSVEFSGGVNTSAIQNPYFVQDGTDYLGLANRTRPSTDHFNFSNSLDPSQITPVNHSVSISGGKRFEIGDALNPLSFYVVGSHSKS